MDLIGFEALDVYLSFLSQVNYKFALKKMPYNFKCAYVQYYFGV